MQDFSIPRHIVLLLRARDGGLQSGGGHGGMVRFVMRHPQQTLNLRFARVTVQNVRFPIKRRRMGIGFGARNWWW